ncbi:hypothetical protein [Rufibacter latericius]|uniref:Uncharacterized protein n=1 Tax=Rufibacter latericius TaxID=2487040 RepID=A0A3M9MNX8_9BACT|nr:hypothetical protein [Rufibacter latericius]RNI26905.1 hypothetical protein EFB08_10540 [Rufibacter latericius]
MTKREYWSEVSDIMKRLDRELNQLEMESGRKFKSLVAIAEEQPNRLGYRLIIKKKKPRNIL